MTKTWWIGAILAAVFVLLGGIFLAVSFTLGGEDRATMLVAGALCLLIGLGIGSAIPGIKRQQDIGDDDDAMREVEPRPAGDAPKPWTEEQLAGDIAARVVEAPYVVLHVPGRIRVRADLADARFLGPMGARGVKEVRTHDVVSTTQGQAAVVDRTLSVSWSAGVDGALRPRVRGTAKAFSGQAFEVSFRKEYGVGADGSVGEQVDWTFDQRELQRPVREALQAAGWKRTWSAEGRLGLVMALVGVGSAVAAGVALLVRWLVG
ncbi:hypothetical protein [Nocardioides marmoraquaticus]